MLWNVRKDGLKPRLSGRVKEIEMEGRINKTAKGFKSYEICEADQDCIFVLADILTR